MATTVRQVLNAAYAKSKKNVPGQIASEATELKGVVYRALIGLYTVAARVNPLFFGDSDDVGYVSPGWAEPDAAESVFRIEAASGGTITAGTEIIVVPRDQLTIEAGNKPAVYYLGQTYRSAGNSGDPGASDSLTFFYSKRPDEPATVNENLDSTWDEYFNELLILETALYLIAKDADPARATEFQHLTSERDRWVKQYVAHLEHVFTNETRQWGHIHTFNTQSIVPLNDLIAGTLAPAA